MKTQKVVTFSFSANVERLAIGFLALMSLVPFLVWHHKTPLTSFYPQIAATALGSLAVIVFLTKQHGQHIKLPLVALLPLCLAVLLGVQFSLDMHTYWQQHFMTVLVLCWASMMAVVGANLPHSKLAPFLASAMLLGGYISFSIVVVQILGWTDFEFILPHIKGGFAANIAQVNHAATYFALALVSASYLLLSERINTASWITASLLFIVALVLTGQRMATLYVLLIAFAGWLIAARGELRLRKGYWLLILIPFYLLLNWFLPMLMGDNIHSPIQRLVETADRESTRLLLLQQAWQIFTENPLLGAGWGQFGWQNFQLTEAYPGLSGYADNAHNIVFQLMAETGVIGSAVFIIIVALWLFAQRKTALSPERWWILASLAVLGIHSLLEYPLWYAYFLGIAALLAGMGEQRAITANLKTGPLIAAAVLIFSTATITSTIRQYHELEGWYTDGRRGDIKGQEAVSLLYELAQRRDQSLFAPYFDVIIIRALPNSEEVVKDKLAMNTQLMRYLPGETEVFSQVDLLLKSGQTEAASEQLAKAIRHYPEHMDSYWKSMTRSLITERDKRYFPLIIQLQKYQDDYLGIEDYR